jgi:hypothetical protein
VEEITSEAIREWLNGLRGQDLSDREVERAAERLRNAGAVALPVAIEVFSDEDEALLAVVTEALKAWTDPSPVEQLLALLKRNDIQALGKALILNILERHGLDVDSPEVLGLGINLEEYLPAPEEPDNGHEDTP